MDINPRIIFKFSKIKLMFDCNICNTSFESSVHHVVNGSWCSKCKKKTELKLYKWLVFNYKNVRSQVKYEWCINENTKKLFSYDFEINQYILIELDGLQHFKQVSNWKSPEMQNERDKYKIKCALENGKHIIHIYQEDVLHDKNKWESKLKKIINKLLITMNPTLEVIGIDKEHFI
jgi:very-short-patch-repair endonuclease